VTIGGGVVACGMRAGSAGIAIPVGVGFGTGSGAFATAALPCAVKVCAGAAFAFEYAFAFVPVFDDEVEPQLDPVEAHGFEGATGCCFADEPQLGPAAGELETGENVAGNDEIARGFVNGMTFADTR
jgi:hypothetical protein